MNEQFQEIIIELEDRLLPGQRIVKPLEQYNGTIQIIDQSIAELRKFIEGRTFPEEEEIEIFKRIKPKIISFKIEEGIRYNVLMNKPIGTVETQVKYFEEEIKVLQSFFRMHAFYYQYYKNGFTELDKIYFLRRAGPLPVSLPEVPETDADYSTPMCFLFAKFSAYERVQYSLIEEISALINSKAILSLSGSEDVSRLKWTGDVVNLVELAYGLWLTGQFNNGNATLNQIVRWFETNLEVNIGIVQKRFTEIERRKRLSITRFLDQMVKVILEKIDSGNR